MLMRMLLLASALAGLSCMSAAPAADPAPQPKRLVGYFAELAGYKAADIPADLLTHVIYAFGLIKDGEIGFDDRDTALGHFRDLRLRKQKYPHLKTRISVGGWGGSDPFSDTALTE